MSGPRLRTDFWIAALRRRAESAGAYVSIARRGAEEAGVVFIMVDRRDGRFDLYGPAPQSMFDTDRPGDRLFTLMVTETAETAMRDRLAAELRFDPDIWIVDIEDRDGRAFVNVVGTERDAFTGC